MINNSKKIESVKVTVSEDVFKSYIKDLIDAGFDIHSSSHPIGDCILYHIGPYKNDCKSVGVINIYDKKEFNIFIPFWS